MFSRKKSGGPSTLSVKVTAAIRNCSNAPVTVFVEPWGQPYEVPPDEKVSITFEETFADSERQAPEIDVEVAPDVISVFGWVGVSSFSVARSGPRKRPSL